MLQRNVKPRLTQWRRHACPTMCADYLGSPLQGFGGCTPVAPFSVTPPNLRTVSVWFAKTFTRTAHSDTTKSAQSVMDYQRGVSLEISAQWFMRDMAQRMRRA
jgi:hypothetical protein